MAKVLATEVEISGQDTAAELAALKATAKAQEAKIKALSAQLRDKKKADMAKRQSSSKDSTCHASLHGCVFDQEFVPHTPGTVLDSGAQVNILEGTLGSGTRIQLTGITGATIEAERADAVFPVIAADGSRHVISIRGKNIVATRTTDNILSLAVLLKAGYKVSFRVSLTESRTLTPRMEVTCTRQRVSVLLSHSQAISGGFQCGAHPHDVRVLPVSLLTKILSLRL